MATHCSFSENHFLTFNFLFLFRIDDNPFLAIRVNDWSYSTGNERCVSYCNVLS